MAWHAVKTWNARIAEMLRCRYDQHARTRIILSKTLKRSQRIKKHGPKTVLNALERSRTIDVSPEKYALSENGGPAGGPLGCDSETFIRFTEQLKAAGFSVDQLVLIGDALRESGLEIRTANSDG